MTVAPVKFIATRVVLVGALVALSACSRPPVQSNRSCPNQGWQREVRYVMGTLLEISFQAPDCESGERLLEQAFDIAQKLDARLSNYKSSSEISKLNRVGTAPLEVSADVYEFLKQGTEFSRQTAGAFDLTVGPLMNLWRVAEERQVLPTMRELARVKRSVGSDKLSFLHGNRVRYSASRMLVDSGGLGKGFAVDRIADFLRSTNIENGYINFGQSSMLAFGVAPDSLCWRVLVPFPEGKPLGPIELKNAALSVSGTLGRTRVIAGQTFGHIVDPATGLLSSRPVQAIVVTDSATAAEAMTKLLVLRGVRGLEHRRFSGVRGFARFDRNEIELSPGFEALLVKSPS